MTVEEPDERGWMLTYTGKRFYPLAPRSRDVDIIDIAHHLSNICRYTGACSTYYSVAQHSVLVSRMAPEHPLWGLLHDASEAYLCDMARPIKHTERYTHYREDENRLLSVILPVFGVHSPAFMPSDVERADYLMCIVEGRQLMPKDPGAYWTRNLDRVKDLPPMEIWDQKRSENEFLDRFEKIYGK